MKGFIGCVSSLLFVSSVFASNAQQASQVTVASLTPGFELSLSALYLQPGANNLGWAATTTVLPIPTPNWSIHTINPGYQTGFNLGARYVWPCGGTDTQLNWTHLRTSDSSHVAVDPSSQWVSPFSQTGTPPTGGEITGIASLKKAEGEVKFNYDVVNLDIGKSLNIGQSTQVRFFAGLSGVYLREKLTSYFNGLPKVAFSLNNTSTYTGIGPRVGVHHLFHFYNDRANIVFQIAGSFLVGRMQPAQYQFTGTGSDLALLRIATNHEGISSSKVNQVVPGMDTKLGINYLFNLHKQHDLLLELGWTGALYINPFSSYETNTNVIALDSGSLSTSSVKHTQSNFSASGVYLTASVAL